MCIGVVLNVKSKYQKDKNTSIQEKKALQITRFLLLQSKANDACRCNAHSRHPTSESGNEKLSKDFW